MKWLAALPLELLRSTVLLIAFGCAATGLMAWVGYLTPALHFVGNLALIGLAASAFTGLVWLAWPPPRKPVSAGPLALIGVALWAALMAPDLIAKLTDRPRPAPAGAEVVKIVQFNLWEDDWSHDDAKFAWIRKQDPDAVMLQEVGPSTFGLIARLAPYYPNRVTCELAPYPCSVTILTKRRPATSGFWHGHDQPNVAWARFGGRFGDYVLVSGHANWPLPDGRQPKLFSSLAADLASLKSDALILTGDFNATPWSIPLREFDRASGLRRHTHLMPTWPAGRITTQKLPTPLAVLPIDHVYASPSWQVVSVERGPDLGSDHYPVVAVLARLGPKTE